MGALEGQVTMPLPVTAKELFARYPRDVARLRFGPEAIRQRPTLGLYMAEIPLAWTKVEMQFAMLLAHASGAHATAAISMYLSLASIPSQQAVVRAAIKDRLHADDSCSLQQTYWTAPDAIEGKEQCSSRLLDNIANFSRGDLILLDRNILTSDWALQVEWKRGDRKFPIPLSENWFTNAKRYREADFKHILKTIEQYHDAVDWFVIQVVPHLVKLRGGTTSTMGVEPPAQYDPCRPRPTGGEPV